jgi:Kelch motif protein/galactose oxidase-like protein
MKLPARSTGIMLLFALAGCASPIGVTTPPVVAIETPAWIATEISTRDSNNVNDIGSIQPIDNMLNARAAHTATLLENGEVLITGGFGQGDNTYKDSAELYDPRIGKFALTGSMSINRCCHTATRLLDGRILIAGGFNGDYLSNAEIYDPETGEFTPTGSLTTPRMDHVAVLLDNGKVFLAGGVGTGWTFLSSAELYDPETGAFTPTGNMSVARESHTITKLQDGRVLITGGHRGRHSSIIIYDSAEIYNPSTGLFTETGHMTLPRHKHDAVLLSDGKVLITGGSDESDDQNAYTSAEIFDPMKELFSKIGNIPTVRYKHIGTSLLLKNGNVLLAGGARNAVIYDEQHNKFLTVPGDLGTATLSRLFSTATLLSNGGVLITGGYGVGQNVSPSAWIYNP